MTAYAPMAATIIRESLELDAEQRAGLDAWIQDSDDLLDLLELANLEGATALPLGAREALNSLAARLSAFGAEPQPFAFFKRGTPVVQRAVDYMFDQLQEKAFRLKGPVFVTQPEEAREPVDEESLARRQEMFRNAVLRRLGRVQAGTTRNDLITRYAPLHREVADGWLDEMEAEGLVRWEPAPPGRRYFLAGEGE